MKPLASSKRQQVDKDKTMAMVAIGVASVVLVAGIIVSKAFWGQATYLNNVAGIKEEAVSQLEENKQSLSSLAESYESFVTSNPNLIGGGVDGTEPNDGDNAKLVLDALPSAYDFPALVSSVENILSPYRINSISGIDDSVTQAGAEATDQPVEMPITVEFTSTYSGLISAVDSFKNSIRPFKINKIELQGTNSQLKTTLTLVSYYQPETGMKIERKVIQ